MTSANISDKAGKFTAISVQEWLTHYLANLLDMEPDDVDVETPFEGYGLDSAAAVAMTGDLEDWLQIELDPTLVYDYPTIEKLANHLAVS
jgi:acyl carrier protein